MKNIMDFLLRGEVLSFAFVLFAFYYGKAEGKKEILEEIEKYVADK